MYCSSYILMLMIMITVFPEGNIVTKSHYRDFQIRWGGNPSRIAEIAVRSVTTTPRRQNLYNNLKFSKTKTFPHIFCWWHQQLWNNQIHDFTKFLHLGCLTFPVSFWLALFCNFALDCRKFDMLNKKTTKKQKAKTEKRNSLHVKSTRPSKISYIFV